MILWPQGPRIYTYFTLISGRLQQLETYRRLTHLSLTTSDHIHIHISKEEVGKESKLLDTVAFSDVKNLAGIRKIQNMMMKGPNQMDVTSFFGSSDRKKPQVNFKACAMN